MFAAIALQNKRRAKYLSGNRQRETVQMSHRIMEAFPKEAVKRKAPEGGLASAKKDRISTSSRPQAVQPTSERAGGNRTRTMKLVHGDLIELALEGAFDVIVHGCNCQCNMGAGLALHLKKAFPEAYQADCETGKGDRSKLGTISTATVERNGHQITIVNGYTQFHYKREQGQPKTTRLADYDAIRSVMQHVKRQYSSKRIAYPLIGAGLAKGDWTIISQIIDEELEGADHTLVKFAESSLTNRRRFPTTINRR